MLITFALLYLLSLALTLAAYMSHGSDFTVFISDTSLWWCVTCDNPHDWRWLSSQQFFSNIDPTRIISGLDCSPMITENNL